MSMIKYGYNYIKDKHNPNANREGYVKEHIIKAQKALGKPLPPNARIHHVDENKLNNANNNLVICEDQAYHLLLHKRTKALKACGHADWVYCKICKQYDHPSNVVTFERHYHKSCNNRAASIKYQRNKKKNHKQ